MKAFKYTKVTCSISEQLLKQAKKKRISPTEALRIGITFLLSGEEGEYSNPKQIHRKLSSFIVTIEKSLKEFKELEDKLKLESKLY